MGDLTFRLFAFLFCAFYSTTIAAIDEHRTVSTSLGQIRGIRKTSLLKQIDFYSFKGIPYAKPPINELRFKAPEAAEPWHPTVLDAFEHGATCLRSNNFLIADNDPQSEDCLFLNVYVPASATSDNPLAVLLWIHGGGFTEWSGNDNLFGPDFLVEQDVILVTINYRLGVLGFMSFDTPDYSGNMGLKDQQLALKWIHENIAHFGGDNKRITIFGESAGGASTHYHVISAESRKYFQNAIALSGTSENVGARSPDQNHIALAHQIAKDLGEPKESLEDLIEFFKTIPADKFHGYGAMTINHKDFPIRYAPLIERKDAKKPFIFESPLDASKIDTNVIFYHTSSELLVHIAEIFMKVFNIWDLNEDFNLTLPFTMIPRDSNEHLQLMQKVRQFYFGNAKVEDKTLLQYIHMMNDLVFAYPAYKSARIHAKNAKGNTYFVRFSVDSTVNLLKRTFNVTSLSGAAHCDETCYIFRGVACQPYYDEVFQNSDSEQSKVSLQTIELITKLFSNFAKYGDPTYKEELISGFHPIRNDVINFLDVTNDGLQLGVNPRKYADEFWTQLEQTAHQIAKEKGIKTHEEL